MVAPARTSLNHAGFAKERRMWPQSRQSWLRQIQASTGAGFLGSDEYATYNDLLEYPPFADPKSAPHPFNNLAEDLARRAAERSRKTSEDLTSDGYFRDRREFERWLHVRTWREALRLVLGPRCIDVELLRLPPEQRHLLQWAYVDQLTDHEVAQMRAAPGDFIGGETVTAARDDCLAAYDALCARLWAVFPDDVAGSVFPRPTFF